VTYKTKEATETKTSRQLRTVGEKSEKLKDSNTTEAIYYMLIKENTGRTFECNKCVRVSEESKGRRGRPRRRWK